MRNQKYQYQKSISTFAGPPFVFPVALVARRFRFFSSNPRPNIRRSDLVGFVDAIKAATRINLDILGKDFIPSSLSKLDPNVPRFITSPGGLARRSDLGWFAEAHSVALVRRGYSSSIAELREELKMRLSLIRTSSVGGCSVLPASPSFISFSDSDVTLRRCSSRTGWTNPGHLAAAMYSSSCGSLVKGKQTSQRTEMKWE